jgi:hypothetical protein
MAIEQVEYKSVGRPSAAPNTVRILPTGVIRLSPDLCTAETFSVAVDKERNRLLIRPDGDFKLWYSSPDAKSGLLTITTAFSQLGLEAKQVAGEYTVRPVRVGFAVDLVVTTEEV